VGVRRVRSGLEEGRERVRERAPRAVGVGRHVGRHRGTCEGGTGAQQLAPDGQKLAEPAATAGLSSFSARRSFFCAARILARERAAYIPGTSAHSFRFNFRVRALGKERPLKAIA